MADVFICHVEDDEPLAAGLAEGLEGAGVACWYYERDSYPGPSYLTQTGDAIDGCTAMIVLISAAALEHSLQMRSEIIQAYESGKAFVPLLVDVTLSEFHERQPEWRRVIGSATAVRVPAGGVLDLMERLLDGLHGLGISGGEVPPPPPGPRTAPSEEAAEAGAMPQAPSTSLDFFGQALNDALEWMQGERDEGDPRYVIVQAVAGYYVQFANTEGRTGVYAEAVSNEYLPEDKRLTPQQESELVQRGWFSPADTATNFNRTWVGPEARTSAAVEARQTFRAVYGVEEPSLTIERIE